MKFLRFKLNYENEERDFGEKLAGELRKLADALDDMPCEEGVRGSIFMSGASRGEWEVEPR